MPTIKIEYPTNWLDYELIDSGDGEKLERFGQYTLIRPDPRIIWSKINPSLWENADAVFVRTSTTEGHWNIKRQPPSNWQIKYLKLIFTLRPTEFKHTGVFPEQAVNWDWIEKVIGDSLLVNRHLKVLNLFAYTGGATLAAASAGAEVTHVDSVKSTIDWAHENAIASGLDQKPIRWIEDDAYKFVVREAKRGNKYDGIIMDPPRFGRGAKGEVWKLEKDLPKLLPVIKQILSPNPTFLLLNAYTADLSPIALGNAVEDITKEYTGITEICELTLKQTSGTRVVPNGIFVRWSKS